MQRFFGIGALNLRDHLFSSQDVEALCIALGKRTDALFCWLSVKLGRWSRNYSFYNVEVIICPDGSEQQRQVSQTNCVTWELDFVEETARGQEILQVGIIRRN